MFQGNIKVGSVVQIILLEVDPMMLKEILFWKQKEAQGNKVES